MGSPTPAPLHACWWVEREKKNHTKVVRTPMAAMGVYRVCVCVCVQRRRSCCSRVYLRTGKGGKGSGCCMCCCCVSLLPACLLCQGERETKKGRRERESVSMCVLREAQHHDGLSRSERARHASKEPRPRPIYHHRRPDAVIINVPLYTIACHPCSDPSFLTPPMTTTLLLRFTIDLKS